MYLPGSAPAPAPSHVLKSLITEAFPIHPGSQIHI